MPGRAGLEPIRRKAAAPLIEEQRTQDGRTLHSAPRVKLNATARPVGMARRNPPQDAIARPEPGPHYTNWSRPIP